MSSDTPARILTSARERFRPHADVETFHSAKLAPKKASQLLAIVEAALEADEMVKFIAPASSMVPEAQFVAATDSRFLAGTSTKVTKLALPLSHVTIQSVRNANSWSRKPDTLAVHHAGKRYKIARVDPEDHIVLKEFAERARVVSEVAGSSIFEQLAAARDAEYPTSTQSPGDPVPVPTSAISAGGQADMGAAIAQLKQLNEFRESGILSQQEFEQAKARLGFSQ